MKTRTTCTATLLLCLLVTLWNAASSFQPSPSQTAALAGRRKNDQYTKLSRTGSEGHGKRRWRTLYSPASIGPLKAVEARQEDLGKGATVAPTSSNVVNVKDIGAPSTGLCKSGACLQTISKPVMAVAAAALATAIFAAAPLYATQVSATATATATATAAAASGPLTQIVSGLVGYLKGLRSDSLIALGLTSMIIPLFKSFRVSPIVGLLLAGTIAGPAGFKWIHDVHLIEHLGELGITLFLFEMGLELSVEKLMSLKQVVFGLGSLQFLITTVVGALTGKIFGLSSPASIVLGGSLALSSSAFVLQLLKDKNEMDTEVGRASFGILLMQDLAVVPLLIVVDLLSRGGGGIGAALGVAGAKAVAVIGVMAVALRFLVTPLLTWVGAASSPESFLSFVLTTLLSMSFLTKGVGLSESLGAFTSGILLSSHKLHHKIEHDIAAIRGILLSLFFVSVGFSIDLKFLLQSWSTIALLLTSLIVGKASIMAVLGRGFGLSWASAQKVGLLNAQGGEFAFVTFAIAEKFGLIGSNLNKLLVTTVALSMAVTPLLAELGTVIAKQLQSASPTGAAAKKDA